MMENRMQLPIEQEQQYYAPFPSEEIPHNPLITGTWQQAILYLQQQNLEEATENTKFTLWLSLAKNTKLSSKMLKEALWHHLALSPEQRLFAVASSGHLTFFKDFLEQTTLPQSTEKLFFYITARYYHKGFLAALMEKVGADTIKKLPCEALYNLVEQGAYHDLVLLYKGIPRQMKSLGYNVLAQMFLIAATHNQLSIMHMLIKHHAALTPVLLNAQNFRAFTSAVINKQYKVIDFFLNIPRNALKKSKISPDTLKTTLIEALDTLLLTTPTIQEPVAYILRKILTRQVFKHCKTHCETGLCLVEQLFQMPQIYLYLEQHSQLLQQHSNVLREFYQRQLHTLRHQNKKLTLNERHLWFNLLRFIIQQSIQDDDGLDFLLTHSSLKSIARTPVSTSGEDALLELAKKAGNTRAIKLLSAIPALNVPASYQKLYTMLDERHYSALNTIPQQLLRLFLPQNNYALIHLACRKGVNPEVISYFFNVAPDLMAAMLTQEDGLHFCTAKIFANHDLLKLILEKINTDLASQLLAANNYACFRAVAQGNHIDEMHLLYARGRELQALDCEAMLQVNDFAVFHEAAYHKDGRLLEFIMKKVAYLVKMGSIDLGVAMLLSRDCAAFRQALIQALIYNSDTVLRHLIDYGTDISLILGMTSTSQALDWLPWSLDEETNSYVSKLLRYDSLRATIMMDDQLLNHPAVFAYIHKYYFHEYQEQLFAFVPKKITAIEQEQQSLETYFVGFSQEKVALCFHIMKFIIIHQLAYLARLLKLPALNKIADAHHNTLLRLALLYKNEHAARLLMLIPAVNDRARKHHYYPKEAQGMLDLYFLSQDNESSMRMLSSEEENQLQKMLDKYLPQIKGHSTEYLTKLRHFLRQRYRDAPAFIHLNGQHTNLPLTMKKLLSLQLNPADHAAALNAYYQHKVHSAWRYLLIPNPWISPTASFVYINKKRTKRWAAFESAIDLFVIFWLAACDDNRKDDFIHLLAGMARAHNWKSVPLLTAKGEQITDALGNPRTKECDNLQADEPTCPSGIKKRLLNSLPLVTEELIQLEINEFVVDHFKKRFKPKHKQTLKNILYPFIIEGEQMSQEDFMCLSELNITLQQVSVLVDRLEEKYGERIYPFINFIKQQFSLPKDYQERQYTHLLAFYSKANLENVLCINEDSSSVSNTGFFSGTVMGDEGKDKLSSYSY